MLQEGYMILKKKNSTNFEENLLFSGIVSHERIKPFKHSFKYNVTYFWFDINISEKYKLLKKNKLSLFSFFDKDHGPVKPKIECLYRYLTSKLDFKKKEIKTIKVLCLPRTIGYVFNPISVFLIYDYKNIPVRIVFEVSNTFGERHAYVCKVNTKGVYYLNKVLYVSPFFKTEGKYKIQFNIKKKIINLLIFYNVNRSCASTRICINFKNRILNLPYNRCMNMKNTTTTQMSQFIYNKFRFICNIMP